ncbi:MAG: hypothetical protein K0R94_392 [Burkholderiales bacterium]|nr:hypothetical protein [Burkholderiales bacterium]
MLEQVLFHVPCPVFWKDLDGLFLGCNKLFLEIGKISDYSELIGKKDGDLPWKRYKDDYRKDDLYVISTGKAVTRIENIPLPDRVIISETTKTPLMQNDKIIGVLGICLDITDRKEKERLEFELKLSQITIEKNALESQAKILKLENEKHQAMAEQQAQFRKIAAQVAHDIASPIFALQMILPRCDDLPEKTRSALSKFSTRIIDITQNFLSQFKQKDDGITINGVTRTGASVYTELTEIVTEKKYEYSNRPIKFVTEINPNSYFTFINVDIDAFKRMMSNLINNSVDALEDKDGIITIHMDTIDDKVQIIIEDNGKGISNDVKDKIMNNITVTSDKLDGHGIGFSQIRDTLNDNEGSFVIESELEQGTKITLNFPKIETPNWITSKIELKPDDLVIIVDDEPYVHEAWECQFKTFVPNITRRHFEQGKEAISYINNLTDEEKKSIFLLTDYELLKQNLNGLDIAYKTKIEQCILVTSHHNDWEIRKQATTLGVKILPKELAFAVIINLVNR